VPAATRKWRRRTFTFLLAREARQFFNRIHFDILKAIWAFIGKLHKCGVVFIQRGLASNPVDFATAIEMFSFMSTLPYCPDASLVNAFARRRSAISFFRNTIPLSCPTIQRARLRW
jgi:hypothetical protein